MLQRAKFTPSFCNLSSQCTYNITSAIRFLDQTKDTVHHQGNYHHIVYCPKVLLLSMYKFKLDYTIHYRRRNITSIYYSSISYYISIDLQGFIHHQLRLRSFLVHHYLFQKMNTNPYLDRMKDCRYLPSFNFHKLIMPRF